jgi:GT2 family glycosyltransferase
VLQGKLLELRLPNTFFDLIFIDSMPELGEDPAWAMRRLKTHLATGGQLVVRLPNPCSLTSLQQLAAGQVPDVFYKSVHNRKKLREVLFEAGFSLISEPFEPVADISASPIAQSLVRLSGGQPSPDLFQEWLHVVAKPLAPVVDANTVGQLGNPTIQGVSIVVLTYNSRATIEACLTSVLRTIRSIDELIVVDNASRDGTAEWVEAFGHSIQLVRNGENLGFSGGSNVGIRASRGSYICLLNPDTEVSPGWLQSLETKLHDAATGMVGPLSDYVTGAQNVRHWVADLPPGSSLRDLARICRERFAGRFVDVKLLIGFCAMFRRETLDKIGLLDESLFLGSDDLEISWRLRTHGFKLAVAQDVFVHHQGGQSFASEDRGHIDQLLFDSTEKLIGKLMATYGWRPPDELLWGFQITHT